METPPYLWGIFAFVIIRGLRALRNKTAPLYRFGIMPAVFILWSMVSLFQKTGLSLSVWLLLWVIGIVVGYFMMRALHVTIAKDSGLVHVPGTVIPLITSASFFIIKYCLEITYRLYPLLKVSILFTAFDSGLSGFISGISLGRFLHIVRRYYATNR
jgi:hypothetical protein